MDLAQIKRAIEGHIAMLERNCALQEEERKIYSKKSDREAMANCYGKICGIGQGITSLQVILEKVEDQMRPRCFECGHPK